MGFTSGVFCILVLFVLPSVLAISCYKCTPRGQLESCKNPQNITNCDNETAPIGVTYDACVTVSYHFTNGETLGHMQCGQKTECDNGKLQEQLCNTTKVEQEQAASLKNCQLTCCQEDKCNDANSVLPVAVESNNDSSVTPTVHVSSGGGGGSGGSLYSILNDLCSAPGANCVDNAPQDACVKASFEVWKGSLKFAESGINCGLKVQQCDNLKTLFCAAMLQRLEQGMTLKKCEFDCCQEDECSWQSCTGSNNDSPSNVASFTIIFTSVIILLPVFLVP